MSKNIVKDPEMMASEILNDCSFYFMLDMTKKDGSENDL